MGRLEPGLPLSVGLGPVSWLLGGLVLRSHQMLVLLQQNRSGYVFTQAIKLFMALRATQSRLALKSMFS